MSKKQNQIRFHSLFIHIMTILSGLTCVISVCFFLYIAERFRAEFLMQEAYSNWASMRQLAAQTEHFLSAEQGQAEALFRRKDCSRLMLAGSDLTAADTFSLMQAMDDLSIGDSYLQKIYFYLPAAGKVISSDHTLKAAEDSAVSGILNDPAAGNQSLLVRDETLYLQFFYPRQKPLGILVCQMDTDSLYAQLQQFNPYDSGFSYIYTYMADGTPVFADNLRYPEEDLLAGREYSKNTDTNPRQKIFATDQGFLFSYISPENGMIYLRQMRSSVLPAVSTLLKRPGFAALLAAVVVLLAISSLLMLRYVFMPVGAVLTELSTHSRPDKLAHFRQTSRNELELITQISRDDLAKSRELRQKLDLARESLRTALLQQLSTGQPIDAEGLQSRMSDCGLSVPAAATWYVLSFYRFTEPESADAALQDEYFYEALRQCAGQYRNGSGWTHLIPEPDHHASLVICLPDDTDPAARSAFSPSAADFPARLQEALEHAGFHACIGISNAGRNFLDLSYLFASARESMQKQLYRSDRSEHPADHDQTADAEDRLSVLHEKLGLLVHKIMTDTIANQEVNETASTIARETMSMDPENSLRTADSLMDTLTEQLIQLQPDLPPAMTTARHQMTAEPSIEHFHGFLQVALALFTEIAGSGQFRYVENACQYIQSHYTDNTLSLEAVSDAMHLSPQYLSRLFSQYKGTGFVNWLNQFRLEQAKKLLVSTGYSVNDIGLKTGFSSSQNFIRVFKKYETVTPGQYRRNHKEGDET